MKEQWKVILMVIILILVVIFALNNTSNVTVNLLLAKFSVPLVLVILFSLLVGVIVGLLTSMAAIHANRKDNTSLTKELNKLQESHASELAAKDQQIQQLQSEMVKAESTSQTSVVPASVPPVPATMSEAEDSRIATDNTALNDLLDEDGVQTAASNATVEAEASQEVKEKKETKKRFFG